MPEEVKEYKLTPANQNPWYLLMIWYGEPSAPEDMEIASQNRLFWHRYMFEKMTTEQRGDLIERGVHEGENLKPFSRQEKLEHEQMLRERIKKNGGDDNYPSNGVIDLSGIEIEKDFIAYNYIFPHHTKFNQVKFRKRANFYNSRFYGYAEFVGVEFSEMAYFRYATFYAWANFKGAVFLSTADYRNVPFNSTTDFSEAEFTMAPVFHGSKMYLDTDWSDTKFSNRYEQEADAVRAERCWSTLKLLMNQMMRHDYELKFFALEMEARTLYRGKSLSYNLYKYLSDFGQSISRPFYWLVGVFVLFWAIFYGMQFYEYSLSVGADQGYFTSYYVNAVALPSVSQSALTSLVNSVPFVGLQKYVYGAEASTLTLVIGVVQTLISSILLFLIGLGIRNRYRIK
ncbi:pentapeptide repeat-containing protein [Paremcibacter congregatus]|uniref:Pentapeptide repeat-containing protein n=1 Tax=Paremcibacter congregatus TaxID=2043170 RepID=A0A2G4YTB3_9PROT|nr:pentapeptide repeat-containing protein [Paremcibacter congregatus]PHZ85582.1 hypothetical protein CRD36_02510 [Paremcibacter congregatus]QDE26542.1 pentapeptide repeat-containing protein [Paremcibacter congregatus]